MLGDLLEAAVGRRRHKDASRVGFDHRRADFHSCSAGHARGHVVEADDDDVPAQPPAAPRMPSIIRRWMRAADMIEVARPRAIPPANSPIAATTSPPPSGLRLGSPSAVLAHW